jgi:hypothetical protein
VKGARRARYGGGERKVTSKNPDGRVVSRIIQVPPKSEVERGADDRRSHEGHRNRYRERFGVAKPVAVVHGAPTEQEMRRRRESYPEPPYRRRRGPEDGHRAAGGASRVWARLFGS